MAPFWVSSGVEGQVEAEGENGGDSGGACGALGVPQARIAQAFLADVIARLGRVVLWGQVREAVFELVHDERLLTGHEREHEQHAGHDTGKRTGNGSRPRWQQ